MLDWVSGDGFADYFERYAVDGFVYKDALEFRQRHLLKALKGLT